MKKNFAASCFFFISLLSIAQIGLSLYPFSNGMGLRTSLDRILSAELRSGFFLSHNNTGTQFQVTPQLVASYRIASVQQVALRIGVSGGISFTGSSGNSWSLGMPFTMVIFPFKDNQHFCITGEAGGLATFYKSRQELSIKGMIGLVFFIYNNLHHDPQRRQ